MKKHTKTMQAFVLVAVLSVSVMASARAELNNTWTTELGGWATISQGQYGYNLYTDGTSNGGISGNVIFAGFDSLSDEVADMYYYAYISAASLRVQPFKTP